MDEVMKIVENADPLSSWWPFIGAVVIGIVMTIRSIMGGQRCPTTNLIDKQIVIVTGGYSGIGFEICKALLARNAHIIIAGKNIEKAEKTKEILQREVKCALRTPQQQNPDVKIEIKYLDLQLFDSVKSFARNICEQFDHIDVLINNAGIIFNPVEKTSDGFEIHLQVNYLSPFLLTHLLLPHLKKSPNFARIINVSAHAHASAKIDFDDPLNIGAWAINFHQRDAFAHSKLAVVLGTKQLAKELKEYNVTVNVYTPGLVRGTGHLKNSPIMSSLSVKLITFPWMWLFMKNPFEGAQTAIYLATDSKLKNTTGEYFNDCEITRPCELAEDEKLAEKLFNQTKRVLKLDL
ncbi:retinol dehydrogenase 13 [Condylostylus longicornis]|uniref:retinol dehydrogenase 13 n=1 Tax=Condylostylus longicornis TaxID=2530218 RepID=UPI00244E479C|nr:retinol dehydrogenase 13 [Condylostylus longicornis]